MLEWNNCFPSGQNAAMGSLYGIRVGACACSRQSTWTYTALNLSGEKLQNYLSCSCAPQTHHTHMPGHTAHTQHQAIKSPFWLAVTLPSCHFSHFRWSILPPKKIKKAHRGAVEGLWIFKPSSTCYVDAISHISKVYHIRRIKRLRKWSKL